MKVLFRSFATVALVSLSGMVSCVTPPEPGSAGSTGAPPSEWPRSPELEKRWGPARPFGPDERIHRKPGIGYRDPKTRGRYVDIVWEDPSQPKEIRDIDGKRASDGQLTIMGQKVDFYGSGNEEPEISTQPVELTSPSGRKEWYSFHSSCKEYLRGRNFPVFTWQAE